MNNKILLLNGDYQPHSIISCKRAISLLLRNKAEKIDNENDPIILNGVDGEKFRIPTVLKLSFVVSEVYKQSVKFNKKNVFIRDKNTCAYCGKKISHPTIDHVIPRSQGGANCFENTVTCCSKCNGKKGGKTPEQAGMTIYIKPYRPSIHQFISCKAEEYAAGMDLGFFDTRKEE